MKETELAAHVVAWLQEQGWTVHEEVMGCDSGIPDIVAVMDRRIWIIECKRTMGLAVMAQAEYWRGAVHWVSVATPRPRRPSGHRRFALSVLEDRGIGKIDVDDGVGRPHVTTALQPKMLRRPSTYFLDRIRAALVPENAAGHELGARAGSACEPRWTTWRGTCYQLRRRVQDEPGIALKTLVDDADGFHYASVAGARSTLSRQLRDGAISGIRIEQDGRQLRLYPE